MSSLSANNLIGAAHPGIAVDESDMANCQKYLTHRITLCQSAANSERTREHAMALFFAASAPLGIGRAPARHVCLTRRPARRTAHAATAPRRRPSMALPTPDDTAVDMMTFMLSGPGWAAWGLFLASIGALVSAFGAVGPEDARAPRLSAHVLRVRTARALRVALADGPRDVREGESVLAFEDATAALAAARALEDAAQAARCAGELQVWHARFDTARGVAAEKALVPRAPVMDEKDDIEKEWAETMRRLATPRIVRAGEGKCKLCGGAGNRRCSRCGGARVSGAFRCSCEEGRVPCDWCGGDGLAP